MPVIALIILLALIIAAVGGGCLILALCRMSRHDICSVAALTIGQYLLYADGAKGWSRPMLTDHAELDQSRHNATRPGEMRREVHTSVQTPQPRSAVAPLMQTALSCGESLFRHPASSFVSVGLPLLRPSSSPFPRTRLASTRTTQLAFLQSAIICSRTYVA